jgi:tetratricopeptide (TPR) repeat protein
MRPLDPLAPTSTIAHLLRSAAAAHVRAELARLEAASLDPAPAAALAFARGAFSLREGSLAAARVELEAASAAFADLGEHEAAQLARCEAVLASIRKGPRAAAIEAIPVLEALGVAAEGGGRAAVVALHYRGAAERALGDAGAAQRSLLQAFRAAEPGHDGAQPERAQILNSLGTLYVVMGAFGAAVALLEHAAELHHQGGDALGEAIAHGQLGAAALALGDLERARKHLQRQEWLASRMGDPLGRARSLTFLADVALEAGRAAEAAELAGFALEAARSVDPPLELWIAYATRARGRAHLELGDKGRARADLEAALAAFARFDHPLGRALCQQDLAAASADQVGSQPPDPWFAPAWALGSLGLPARVARLLGDRRAGGVSSAREGMVLAAMSQSAPHLAADDEVALVYSAPEALASIASRRTTAQRNLGRLAALAIAPPGLVVAAIAADAVGGARRTLPPERAAAAALAELPGMALWVWPATAAPEEIGRDLAAARAALGEDARAVLVLRPRARVLTPPFLGEVGAEVEGVDAVPLVRAVGGLEEGELVRGVDVPWSPEAEARVAMAGFAPRH